MASLKLHICRDNKTDRVMSQHVFEAALISFVEAMNHLGLTETTVSIYSSEILAHQELAFKGIGRFGIIFQGVKLKWELHTKVCHLRSEDLELLNRFQVEYHIELDEKAVAAHSEEDAPGSISSRGPRLPWKLLRDHKIPTHINSMMIFGNNQYIKDIVEVAKNYSIKTIHLNPIDDLVTIPPKLALEYYRKAYYYALDRGVEVTGPWSKVLQNYRGQKTKVLNLPEHLTLDVNSDGSCYISLDRSGTQKLNLHIDGLMMFFYSGGWKQLCDEVVSKNDLACNGCKIKEYCFGEAIEQAREDLGEYAHTTSYCEFYRDWISFLTRPIFLRRSREVELLSVIPEKHLGAFSIKLEEAIAFLSIRLWPLDKPVKVLISEYHEELLSSSRQYFLPEWTKATTGKGTLFHKGPRPTPHMIHELTHVFLYLKGISLPVWFEEGVCEWLQNPEFDRTLLIDSVRKMPLSNLPDLLAGKTNMISLDQSKPGSNSLYIQAQAFVGDLISSRMHMDLSQLLLECLVNPLDTVLRRKTGLDAIELLVRFEARISEQGSLK